MFDVVHEHGLEAHATQVAWSCVDALDGVVAIGPLVRACGSNQVTADLRNLHAHLGRDCLRQVLSAVTAVVVQSEGV